MPDDITQRVNAALTACNGDREQACAMLGITRTRLNTLIHNRVKLKELWAKSDKVQATTSDLMDGPSLVPAETDAAREQRSEAEFKKLLESTGLQPEDVTEAVSLSKLYGQKIGYCVDLIGGGITARVMKLLKLAKHLDERFEEGFSGEGADQALATWTELYISVHNTLGQFMERATVSQVAREKIKAFQAQAAGKSGHAKPSFGPKQTNIIAHGPLQVNG